MQIIYFMSVMHVIKISIVIQCIQAIQFIQGVLIKLDIASFDVLRYSFFKFPIRTSKYLNFLKFELFTVSFCIKPKIIFKFSWILKIDKNNSSGVSHRGVTLPLSGNQYAVLSRGKKLLCLAISDGFKWDKVLNSIKGIRACMVINCNNMVVQYVGRGDPQITSFPMSKSKWCLTPPPKKMFVLPHKYLGQNGHQI